MLQMLNHSGKLALSRAPGFTSKAYFETAKEYIIDGELEILASNGIFPSSEIAKL